MLSLPKGEVSIKALSMRQKNINFTGIASMSGRREILEDWLQKNLPKSKILNRNYPAVH